MRLICTALVVLLLPAAQISAQTDDQLLDTIQHSTFNYFWNAPTVNTVNGLIRDRSEYSSPASIASVGFGLTAICIAVDHGWITRTAGRDRVLATIKTFWLGPQGPDTSGKIGCRGFFYHFLDMTTARRYFWSANNASELSTMDTGLLLAGILYAKEYFTTSDSLEGVIRALADSIYARVDWEWMRNANPGLPWAWSPETGFAGFGLIQGYNEAMITQLLALGSPTHPVPASVWTYWTSGYSWQTWYGYSYVNFPPLFGHQYSHCWIDFRNIWDSTMKARGITYFENSRRATLAQRVYCAAYAPAAFGYTDSLWGLTACDGPAPASYTARGAPPAQNDDGTIAPTAPAGSLPFAPEVVIPALRNMYNTYRTQLWFQYGFRDAFNVSQNWWDADAIGIDEGPIIVMIENYRTQSVWSRFMQNADVLRGLQRAGFIAVGGVSDRTPLPEHFRLYQNYPNPFNGSTTIAYELARPGRVILIVYNLLGEEVATLFAGRQSPGIHSIAFSGEGLPSGVYTYVLRNEGEMASRRFVLMK